MILNEQEYRKLLSYEVQRIFKSQPLCKTSRLAIDQFTEEFPTVYDNSKKFNTDEIDIKFSAIEAVRIWMHDYVIPEFDEYFKGLPKTQRLIFYFYEKRSYKWVNNLNIVLENLWIQRRAQRELSLQNGLLKTSLRRSS